MKTLKQLLAEKNRLPVVVSPKDMVFHALQVMADNGVGAVLVMDGERLVGIFSERDYARKIALANKNSKETPVSEVMTSKVAYVPGTAFFTDGLGSRNMRLSFCFPPPDRIEVGVRRFAEVVRRELEVMNTFGVHHSPTLHDNRPGPSANLA